MEWPYTLLYYYWGGCGKCVGFQPLSNDRLTALRCKLSKLMLLIIEEISMVGPNMLLQKFMSDYNRLKVLRLIALHVHLVVLVNLLLVICISYHPLVNLLYLIKLLIHMLNCTSRDLCGKMNLLCLNYVKLCIKKMKYDL